MLRALLVAGVLVAGGAALSVALAAGSSGGAHGGGAPTIVTGKMFVTAPGVVVGPAFVRVTGVGSSNFLRRVPVVARRPVAEPIPQAKPVLPLCQEKVKGVLILRGRGCDAKTG